jgi:CheY-like chemotaxis protein
MKILVAEDEPNISLQYKVALEQRGHQVVLTNDGVKCVETYQAALQHPNSTSPTPSEAQTGSVENTPFDVVILDYRMPRKNGLETAKEILTICPKQRIVFASAFVTETLRESAKDLHQIVELIQKPFHLDYLIEIVEDTEVYRQLAEVNVKVKELRNRNLKFSELVDLLAGVKKLQSMASSVANSEKS